jgi:hypothetical protein
MMNDYSEDYGEWFRGTREPKRVTKTSLTKPIYLLVEQLYLKQNVLG